MRILAAAFALASFLLLAAAGTASADLGTYIGEWSTGKGTWAVTLGPDGSVYASSYRGLLKYSTSGVLQATIGDSVLQTPYGVAFDAQGNIYVADIASTVHVFSPAGLYLRSWATGGDFATYLAIDAQQRVLVTDIYGSTVRLFTTAGVSLGSWLIGSGPTGIAIDDLRGVFYLSLAARNRIVKYSLDGYYMAEFGALQTPFQLALTPDGGVIFAEEEGYRVSAWTSAGTFVGSLGSHGTGQGQFGDYPLGIACSADGVVYVAERSGRIQKFAAGATPSVRSSWSELKLRYR